MADGRRVEGVNRFAIGRRRCECRFGQPAPGATASDKRNANATKVHVMLYTIAVVLLILWLLGLVTSYTLGGFIHILLVVAVVMVLVNVVSGRHA